VLSETPTAPIAAFGLIAGFAVALATGSRPLGGVVLAILGTWCLITWNRRDGRRTAAVLGVCGLAAFAASHVLGLVIGAWPAVFTAAAFTAAMAWRLSDARRSPRRLTPEL
jgi:predicted membrane-bound dolichyl-phosphate-mannose-protein mannosyltransferase